MLDGEEEGDEAKTVRLKEGNKSSKLPFSQTSQFRVCIISAQE
jgi:hypothetical protein